MKKLLSALFTAIFIISSIQLFAQKDNKINTETIEVEGMCGMCKKRIENAAYIKGVKRAEWNPETKKLTVVYNTKTTSREKIVQSIVKAGHDADGVQAEEKTVQELPACCNYRDPNNPHNR